MRTLTRSVLLVLSVLTLIGISACRSSSSTSTTPESTAGANGAGTGGAAGGTTIKGMANTGLKSSINPLVTAYKKANPKVTVNIEYLSSKEIQDKVAKGEKPDFVIDGFSSLNKLAGSRLAGTKDTPFGVDFIQIAVKAGNPKGITDLKPFGADASTRSGLCASEEPCGRAGAAIVSGAGLTPAPDVFGDEPSALVTNLVNGEIDAALLFRADLKGYGGDKLTGVDVPGIERAEQGYQIMVLTKSNGVDAFVTWLKSDPAADAVLVKSGLRPFTSAGAKPAAAPTTTRR